MRVFIDAYLFNNLGDDLFVDMLLHRYPDVYFSVISHFYQKECNNVTVYHNKYLNKIRKKTPLYKGIIDKCDMSISIGGSMYIETEGTGKYPYLGENYYILGANFGPYITEEYYQKGREFFRKAKDVCFRDNYSYQLFQDLPNVRKAPDILWGLDVSDITITNRKRVIFSIISYEQKVGEGYKDNYEKLILNWINFFHQKGYEICLMSFCKIQGDEWKIEKIKQKCKIPVETYYYRGNRKEALSVLADSQIIVGTRFHANILGMLLGKTVLPIAYTDKTIHMLEDMQYEGEIVQISSSKNDDIDFYLTEEDLKRKQKIDTLKKEATKQWDMLDKKLKRK